MEFTKRYSGQTVVSFEGDDVCHLIVMVETPGGARALNLDVAEVLREHVNLTEDRLDAIARQFIGIAIYHDEHERLDGLVEEGRSFVEPTIRTERWACFTLTDDNQETPYVGRTPEQRWPTPREVERVQAAALVGVASDQLGVRQ